MFIDCLWYTATCLSAISVVARFLPRTPQVRATGTRLFSSPFRVRANNFPSLRVLRFLIALTRYVVNNLKVYRNCREIKMLKDVRPFSSFLYNTRKWKVKIPSGFDSPSLAAPTGVYLNSARAPVSSTLFYPIILGARYSIFIPSPLFL